MPQPKEVHLEFHQFEEPETLQRKLEVKAVDPDSGFPVATLSREEMGRWLASQGYKYVPCSAGIWARP